MLNNVTGDLQWDWVTHKNSKTMAVWCSGYDGFVCLWCLKSAHKHWHRDLPWTHPHKYRLVHIKLTSSLGYSLFHPPLPLSISSHTNVQANGYISTHWVGGAKKHPMLSLSSNLNVIMQMGFAWSMQQCGHLESTLTVISYTHSQPFMSAANVYGCWTVSKYESAFICIPHTHPWKLAFIKLKEMSGKSASVTFQPIYKVLAIFFKLDIGMGT